MKALKIIALVPALLVVLAVVAVGGQWTYAAFNNSRTLLGLGEFCAAAGGCVLRVLPDGQLVAAREADACPPPQPGASRF